MTRSLILALALCFGTVAAPAHAVKACWCSNR